MLQKARQHGAPSGLVARLLTAVALRMHLPVATAEAAWKPAPDGLEVILIRDPAAG